jgi:dephospho-CoA kinase
MTRRPVLVGLTGSIGMGKTTTARLFAEAGVPVWDADAAVHRLYGPGEAGTETIARLAPGAVGPAGVDRRALREAIAADPELLARVETAVHPLVAADRAAFVEAHRDAPLVVLDIPLLFETGGEAAVDAVVVVTAPPQVQRQRVLARPGMDVAQFERILSRQVPDEEKRRRADHVVQTDEGVDRARQAVLSIIEQLTGPQHA